MTTVIMLMLWATAFAGWLTALHLYTAGRKNMSPNTDFIIGCIIAAVVSAMVGTLLLSALNNVSGFHSAFGI